MVLLIILMPTIFFLSISHIKSKKELSNAKLSHALKIINYFETTCNEHDLLLRAVTNNQDVVDFANELYSDSFHIITNAVESLIKSSTAMFTNIESIYVYSDINNYIISNVYNAKANEFHDNDWCEKYLYLSHNETEIVLRRLDNDFLSPVLSFIMPIYNFPNQITGLVVINLNIEHISNIIKADLDNFEVNIYNKYSKLVFSTFQGKDNEYTNYIESTSLEQNKFKYIFSERRHVISKFIYTLSYILFILVILILAIIVSGIIAIYTFKPLQAIINKFNFKQEQSNSYNCIENETEFIIKNIQLTQNKNVVIQQELEEKTRSLNQAFSIALQAQINPHFLYNTLETINILAYKKYQSDNEISTIVISLAQMLKMSINNEKKLIPLELELEHINLFINILNIRYPGQLEFTTNIPNDLFNLSVVKLSLQPLVENAFLHGIRPTGNPGKIIISAFTKNDNLIMQIKDNGCGIPANQLLSLCEDLNDNEELPTSHIGIKNVNHRIKLLFGNSYGLTINSQLNKGTTVTLTIPKI